MSSAGDCVVTVQGRDHNIWSSLLHGFVGGCKLRMPGIAGRERSVERRAGGGRGPRKRSLSSRRHQNTQGSAQDDVVITAYQNRHADLPPISPATSPVETTTSPTRASSSASNSSNVSQAKNKEDTVCGRRMKQQTAVRRAVSFTDVEGHSSDSQRTAVESSSSSRRERSTSRSRASRAASIPRTPSNLSKSSSPQNSSPLASTQEISNLPLPELAEISKSLSSLGLNEDDLTCPICLDVLKRPRALPCNHSFCLLCLQNYVNSCRNSFSCPSCRGPAQIPPEGVVGFPVDEQLVEGARLLQLRRKVEIIAPCLDCKTTVDLITCGHCHQNLCQICGPNHATQVSLEVDDLRERLSAARSTLHCKTEEDEIRLSKLEGSVSVAVEERIAQLMEEQVKLKQQIQAMRSESQTRSEKLSKDIDSVLADKLSEDAKWCEVGQLHESLTALLKSASTVRGPRVTLDESELKLSSTTSEPQEDSQLENKDDEEEETQQTAQNHSLIYRKKGSLSKKKWSLHLCERPAGVAVSPWNNEIFVTGSDTCRVFIFDSSGRQIDSFGSRGHKDGQFLCPIAIAFSLVSKEVFITDKWKHCIHVFDTEGNFIRQLGRKGSGYGHFSSPEGIAVDRQGLIYVADTCNHRVQVLDGDGVFLREVGVVSTDTRHDGRRYTKSEFNEPTGVGASLDGSRVYVADAGNHRVKVFDGTTDERVLMFGSRGRNKGQFESPECITVDPNGFILVGDSGNGRVQIFRPNGNFIRYLGSRSSRHGEIGWVSGIGISKNLDVIVTDFKNNCVCMF